MRTELVFAIRQARASHSGQQVHQGIKTVKLSNGWHVRVDSELYHSGRAVTWRYLYWLISPTANLYGGYTRQDSFVGWALKFMQEGERK